MQFGHFPESLHGNKLEDLSQLKQLLPKKTRIKIEKILKFKSVIKTDCIYCSFRIFPLGGLNGHRGLLIMISSIKDLSSARARAPCPVCFGGETKRIQTRQAAARPSRQRPGCLGWARDDGSTRESLAGPRSGVEDTGAQISPQSIADINK